MSSFQDYSTAGLTANNPLPISSQRDPTTSDVIAPDGAPYNVGRPWINTVSGGVFQFIGHGVWSEISNSAAGPIDTLTGDSGTATPAANNVKIAGTAHQIATAASASTLTLSLIGPYTPATYTAHGVLLGEGTGSIVATAAGATGSVFVGSSGADPGWTGSPSVSGSLTAANNVTATAGSVSAGTSMTATLGDITATNGNLVMGTAGNKIIVPTGSNASAGTSGNMSGTPGVVTVATTACSATAKVFYARAVTGGTMGNVSITAQDGTGFTLTSTGNETSTFNWWIINA